MQPGPRVYTFFLYLSDVEEGGTAPRAARTRAPEPLLTPRAAPPRVFSARRACAPRTAGGTNFPYLNVTVMPKKGSAVLWPHGLDSDPRTKDTRTHHEAMPVIKGMKRAANYWIHGSDFKGSMASGCDGRQKLKPRIWRTGDRGDRG